MMYSFNYYNTFLYFKTNDAGCVYRRVPDGSASLVGLIIMAYMFLVLAARGPGIKSYEGLRG